DIFDSSLAAYRKDGDKFPGNWIHYLQKTYGAEKLGEWVRAVSIETGMKPAELANMMRKFGLKERDIFFGSYAMTILTRNMARY
ncbi:MAG: hypothetical protein HQL53_13395, partial [Magnetococcales bacterium]|nr:hypothetical protein [Magnetococcales bacterium]